MQLHLPAKLLRSIEDLAMGADIRGPELMAEAERSRDWWKKLDGNLPNGMIVLGLIVIRLRNYLFS
jgi:hypothetical protein